MFNHFRKTTLGLWLGLCTISLSETQSEYYVREPIPLPNGEIMEISSIALMPNEQIAVATRRGDIWICSGAYGDDLTKVSWKKFAVGLHEPLGMFYQNEALRLTQRPDFSEIKDTDKDGFADQFKVISQGWGIGGDYHEYAFGSRPDKNGDVWVVLCLTGSWDSDFAYRGWSVRITPEGQMIPTASGIRSPGGIGQNAEGDMFYTDNQGTWNGSSSLKWLKPGSFQGNPEGNKWHKKAGLPEPLTPEGKTRILAERLKDPRFIPPAVILPHARLGQSPTGIEVDTSGGKFGPWENQLYIGEQTHSQVQRVALEKVNGIYQGAAFHMLENFQSGPIPVRLNQENGMLFIGGSSRGWASRGNQPFNFERVRWTGKTPFEIQTINAKPDGFLLNFTQKVDPETAGNPSSYSLDAWTYILQSGYGSPEVDRATPIVKEAIVSENGMSVHLKIEGLVRGHVHEITSAKVKSANGKKLWHPIAYYTLNEIPAAE